MTLKNTPTNFSHKFKALQLTFQVVFHTQERVAISIEEPLACPYKMSC